MKELKSFKNDNKILYDQNKKLKDILQDKKLLVKESSFFESLLVKVLNILPLQDLKIASSNIIDLHDISNNYEKDKIKLEKKVEDLEKEYKIIKKEEPRNEELENSLVKQIQNIKNLVYEYDKKISNKKNEMLLIEKKFFSNYYENNNNFTADYKINAVNNLSTKNSFNFLSKDLTNLNINRIESKSNFISTNQDFSLNFSNPVPDSNSICNIRKNNNFISYLDNNVNIQYNPELDLQINKENKKSKI